jgi:hypothetical protein
MKRSSDNLCAPPPKKVAKECNVCYEPKKGHNCRVCNKHICRSCLKQWKATCNKQRKKPDCPFCRTIWDKPNFFVKAPHEGQANGTDITIYCGAPYVLKPIAGEKVEGFVVLNPELIESPIEDLTPGNLENLEKYAADIKWLFKDLEDCVTVMSTDIPEEIFKKKFAQKQVHLEQIMERGGRKIYGCLEFEEIIMSGLVMEFNLF